MPVWHDATLALQASGRLAMAGILQEQNADRGRLFMQWQGMDWPVMVDAFDRLEVGVVPLTLAIDEHGIIRHMGLRRGDAARIEAIFVDQTYPAPTPSASALPPAAAHRADLSRHRARGDDLAAAWTPGAPAELLDRMIEAYRGTVARAPEDAWAQFRLAVALRLRHDEGDRRSGDFQGAVDHWGRALALDPNNYIWRRRIQQYGPRLAKPYPFYDWVPTARREIRRRGAVPVALRAEPSASEIADPRSRDDRPADGGVGTVTGGGAGSPAQGRPFPDPQNRVRRDGDQGPRLVRIEATVVPGTVSPGDTVRVHLVLEPEASVQAHWNNEAEPLGIWVGPADGWGVPRPHHTVPLPPRAVSQEPRRVEWEATVPAVVPPDGVYRLPVRTLYYVCEDVRGTCLYRRQDMEVRVPLQGEQAP